MDKKAAASVSRESRWAPVATLRFNPANARTHSAEQIAQLAAAIREFGFTMPALIDETGLLIAGEGRVRGAMAAGLDAVRVVDAIGWTDEQKRAYALADNKIALNAGWNTEVLRSELSALRDLGLDLSTIGFSRADVAALLPRQFSDPDDVPETPETPVARRGELWRLGEHRLLCGDAINADDVARVLGGTAPHLMVTDPPYGVDYDPNWRNEANRWSGSNVKLGAAALGTVDNDAFADWSAAWKLFPGDVAYVWHAALNALEVARSLVDCGFELRSQLIWNKMRGVIGRGHYHWQHEPLWYAVRKGSTGHWTGSRTESTVWDIPKPQTSETGHSTQKPVECMRRPIVNNSAPGDAVFDPFVGSGTTIIAAEMEGRRCYALEINPAYCDVTIRRWQTFTRQIAHLDGGGPSFDAREAVQEGGGVMYEPTQRHRELVWSLAQRGIAPADIVLLLQQHDGTLIDERVLKSVFDWELRMGRAQGNLAHAERLHKSAEAGNVAAQIFLSKVFLGWTERGPAKTANETDPKYIEALPDDRNDGDDLAYSGEVVAALLGISGERLRQLTKEGMPKLARGKFPLKACVQWYIAYWRDRALSRIGNDAKTQKQNFEAQLLKDELRSSRGETVEAGALRDTLQGAFRLWATYDDSASDTIISRLQLGQEEGEVVRDVLDARRHELVEGLSEYLAEPDATADAVA